MSSKLFDAAWEKAETMAKACKITDTSKIREMACDYLKEETQKYGQELVDSLNIMGGDVQQAVLDGLSEGLNRTHRELQSEFWKLMLKLITRYGNLKYHDGRNKWAVDMCKRMGMAGEDPRTEEILNKHIEDHRF